MKTLGILLTFILAPVLLLAQTDGISYQAVIIDPSVQELPGVDLSGNILPNRPVALQFTIYDENNEVEYQEVHQTTTDEYGMVNLLIGRGEPTGLGSGDFTLIDWNGRAKDLEVEINFEGSTIAFENMSRQELTFVPYAYHRNITATGDMIVDGTTDLNGRLLVQGPTNLNNTLNVTNGNASNLSGDLLVEGNSIINGDISVFGTSTLSDTISITDQSPVFFSGDITVAESGTATFNGPTVFNSPANFNSITVNGQSDLQGQVVINANMDTVGGEDNFLAYPLLLQGSGQGLAIKVNGGRSIDNNYISFWDSDTDQMWGRIEGLTLDEQSDDLEYQLELGARISDIVINGVEAAIAALESGQAVVKLTAAGTSSTACAGLGACVTAPIPSLIAESSSNLVLKIANVVSIGGNLALAIFEEETFRRFARDNIGVSYQSGAGDYAEWLMKENPSENFKPGELVGVNNGKVSKNLWDAEKVMVVSTRPIVLGNMPDEGLESNYVKIAFMGQVPVRVFGKVDPGDYILPHEAGNGFAKAVNPENMRIEDYKKICGVAWSTIDKISDNFSIINCAVGLNANEISDVVARQNEQLQELQAKYENLQVQVYETDAVLSELLPGYSKARQLQPASNNSRQKSFDKHDDHSYTIAESDEEDVIYFDISRTNIEAAIEMARDQYVEMYQNKDLNKLIYDGIQGNRQQARTTNQSELEQLFMVDISEHPFWQKIDNDPAYKKEIINFVMNKVEKAFHTHEKFAHKFSDLQQK